MERPGAQRWSSREVARLLSLVESERRFYQEMISAMPLPVATVSAESVVLSANRAFLREFSLVADELDRHRLGPLLQSGDCRTHLNLHARTQFATAAYAVHLVPLSSCEPAEPERMAVLTPLPAVAPPPPQHARAELTF